jgi:hypothetical protein
MLLEQRRNSIIGNNAKAAPKDGNYQNSSLIVAASSHGRECTKFPHVATIYTLAVAKNEIFAIFVA